MELLHLNSNKEIIKARIAYIAIVLIIVCDQLTGLLLILETDFSRIGLIPKAALTLVSGVYYIRYCRQKSYQSLYLLLLLLIGLWLIGSSTSALFNYNFKYLTSVVVFSRYTFIFFLAMIFIDLGNNETFRKNCKLILETILIGNAVIMFCGAIFKIDILSTYDPYNSIPDHIQRFGYKGLFFGGNDVATFYLIGLAYIFRQTFKYKEKKWWMLIIIFVATIITGTKAAFFGALCISGYYIVRYNIKTTLLLIFPLLILLAIILYNNWNILQQKYFVTLTDYYMRTDLLTFLMTGRNQNLLGCLEVMINDWTFWQFITGDGHLYSETDIKDSGIDHQVMFVILILLAAIGGHVIQSPLVSVFLMLFVFTASNIPTTKKSL
jgi:hypothetical protein